MRKSLLIAATMLALAAPAANAACTTTWNLVGTDTFRYHDALMRSQGVTTDGSSWFFSWQGGVSHTLDNSSRLASTPCPPSSRSWVTTTSATSTTTTASSMRP